MVGITETVLRDAHQSLIATRMRTRHMLPIAERLDAIGYRSLEVWGGATFDVCLRYLKEDPWERLRLLKKAMPRTPLQMLLRGQNLVGYRPYADDLVEAFVEQAARTGVDIFRVFDALNDPANMESALRAVKRAGATAQGTICYTHSPVHTLEAFVALGRRLAELGADELCIKDMAGFLPPGDASSLTRALVREVGLPVVLHTHSASGMATLSCLAAADAGATAVDAAISPFSGGASQPPTETLVGAMRSTALDPKLDLGALAEIAEYFSGVLEHYRPLLNPRSLMTDPGILVHQVPGGMLSNLLSQLQEQDAIGRLAEVLAEIPRVRADLGYPPLVTPTSQIVGIQAVLNVLTGTRYREITREVRDYVRGVYGAAPGPIDPELAKRVLSVDPAVTGRPSDRLPPSSRRRSMPSGRSCRRRTGPRRSPTPSSPWCSSRTRRPGRAGSAGTRSPPRGSGSSARFVRSRSARPLPPRSLGPPPRIGSPGRSRDEAACTTREVSFVKVTLEIDGEHREVEVDLALGIVTVGGSTYPVKVVARDRDSVELEIAGERVKVAGWPSDEANPTHPVTVEGERFRLSVRVEAGSGAIGLPERTAPTVPAVPTSTGSVREDAIVPPMPGRVIEVRVREGERVAAGALLLVLEAMKMRNEIVSPRAGVVRDLHVSPGSNVKGREIMLRVVADDPAGGPGR